MIKYRFSTNLIDAHTEKIGIDVRPAIEVKMERHRLWEFGQYIVDEYPQIFESLVTGTSEFHVRKKLVFPGKGEADVQTLTLTSRGPVFIFPRRISELEEEPELPDANDIVGACVKKFLDVFPDRRVVRAGKVNEFIYSCDDQPSKTIVAERFLRISENKCEDVMIRVNLANDDYNRIVAIEARQGLRQRVKDRALKVTPIFGIAVNVDFNNKDMSEALSLDRILSILRRADEFTNTELLPFLNEG